MARRVTPSASRPSSRCSASSRSSRAPGGSCVAARPPAKRSGSCCVARTTCSGYGGTPPSSNQPGRPPPERPPGELPRTTTAAIGQPAEPSPEAPERPGRSMTWRRVLCATAWYQPESTVAQSGGPAVGAERVRPLPVAAVHDVVERAPVGPLDRRERTVGGDAEGDQQGAEPVLGKAQEAPRELLVVDAGMGAADAEVGGGQHDAHRRLAQVELDQVAHLGVVGAWGTSAIVAAEPATWRAAGPTLASCASCSRSVQTTKSHACWLPAEGVRRAASRIRSRSSGAIARSP